MRRTLLILIMIICFCEMNAQRPSTGLWTIVSLPVNFSRHWQWHNDASYRTLGTSLLPFQYLYRTGVRYNFSEKLNTAAGMAFFSTKTDFDKSHHEFGFEFRLWQEGIYQPHLNEHFKLLLRLRTEERFFDATSNKASYTAYRFRFRAGIAHQLSDKWEVQLADEYMQQHKGDKLGFDQNRVNLSATYKINNAAQFQCGYIWIDWPGTDQHIATISFSKTISFYAH